MENRERRSRTGPDGARFKKLRALDPPSNGKIDGRAFTYVNEVAGQTFDIIMKFQGDPRGAADAQKAMTRFERKARFWARSYAPGEEPAETLPTKSASGSNKEKSPTKRESKVDALVNDRLGRSEIRISVELRDEATHTEKATGQEERSAQEDNDPIMIVRDGNVGVTTSYLLANATSSYAEVAVSKVGHAVYFSGPPIGGGQDLGDFSEWTVNAVSGDDVRTRGLTNVSEVTIHNLRDDELDNQTRSSDYELSARWNT